MTNVNNRNSFAASPINLDVTKGAAAPSKSAIEADRESSRRRQDACGNYAAANGCAAAVPTLTVGCTPPQPQLFVYRNTPACQSREFTYKLPDLALPPSSCEHVVPVEYQVGGMTHHVYAGNLSVPGSGQIAVVPRINMQQDTVHVYHPQSVIDTRGQLTVAQHEAQLLAVQAAAPCAAPVAQVPMGALPLGKAAAYDQGAAYGKAAGFGQAAYGKAAYGKGAMGDKAPGTDQAQGNGSTQGQDQGGIPGQGGNTPTDPNEGGDADGEVVDTPEPGDESALSFRNWPQNS